MQTKVNEKLFKDQSIYVGIDAHKKNWEVTISGQEFIHKSFSQDPSPDLLAGYLKRNFPGASYHAVYEAGFSGFGFCRRLRDLGIDCIVIHPADVPTTHKQKIQKTDRIDSRKLAKMLRGKELEAIHLPESKLEADRALVRQRYKLMKEVARTKNRLKSLLLQFGIATPERFTQAQTRHCSKVYLNWLKSLEFDNQSLKQTFDNYLEMLDQQRKNLLKVNRQVRALSQSDDYRTNYNLLISIPGVGFLTAMTFLTEIGDIKRFPSLRYLNNFIGLVPTMHASGDKFHTGRMVKRGRRVLKALLIEASWRAVRLDPALMAKYNELTRTMKGNKAIIRIARKMLSRMRHVLQYQELYKIGTVN